MEKEILFIGGPADGQRHVIDDEITTAFAEGKEYKRKSIVSRSNLFEFFTFGEMRSFEILAKLIEGYRRV